MKKCIYCNERPAEVPDRRMYTGGRFVKKVCFICHSKLLRGDLINIVRQNKRGANMEKIINGDGSGYGDGSG